MTYKEDWKFPLLMFFFFFHAHVGHNESTDFFGSCVMIIAWSVYLGWSAIVAFIINMRDRT